jgi:hypothetical protein
VGRLKTIVMIAPRTPKMAHTGVGPNTHRATISCPDDGWKRSDDGCSLGTSAATIDFANVYIVETAARSGAAGRYKPLARRSVSLCRPPGDIGETGRPCIGRISVTQLSPCRRCTRREGFRAALPHLRLNGEDKRRQDARGHKPCSGQRPRPGSDVHCNGDEGAQPRRSAVKCRPLIADQRADA